MIEIKIKGPCGSGRSLLLDAIKDYLKQLKIESERDPRDEHNLLIRDSIVDKFKYYER